MAKNKAAYYFLLLTDLIGKKYVKTECLSAKNGKKITRLKGLGRD